jgi:citronellol/citronellal dehydrogenase
MKLEGKVAIITGAARGLGNYFAVDFAKEGADIVIVDRAESDVPGAKHKTAEEVQALGRRALTFKCDIGNEDDVNAMVQKTLEAFGRIDILVNNAGVAWWPPITETPVKRFELVIRVNLIGPFICVKAVLPTMIKQRSGSIINISSGSAEKRIRGFSGLAYGTSKAALQRLTWGMAAELGQYNIAVNAIKPQDPIGTEGVLENAKPDVDKSSWASPELMVKACTFLACQDASGVTGVVANDNELCQWHGLDNPELHAGKVRA